MCWFPRFAEERPLSLRNARLILSPKENLGQWVDTSRRGRGDHKPRHRALGPPPPPTAHGHVGSRRRAGSAEVVTRGELLPGAARGGPTRAVTSVFSPLHGRGHVVQRTEKEAGVAAVLAIRSAGLGPAPGSRGNWSGPVRGQGRRHLRPGPGAERLRQALTASVVRAAAQDT